LVLTRALAATCRNLRERVGNLRQEVVPDPCHYRRAVSLLFRSENANNGADFRGSNPGPATILICSWLLKVPPPRRVGNQCPLCLQKRTLYRSRGISAKCQKRNSAQFTLTVALLLFHLATPDRRRAMIGSQTCAPRPNPIPWHCARPEQCLPREAANPRLRGIRAARAPSA